MRYYKVFIQLILLFWLSLVTATWAQQPASVDRGEDRFSFVALTQSSKKLDEAETRLKILQKKPVEAELNELIAESSAIELEANVCITQTEAQKKQLQELVTSLGIPDPKIGEDYPVRQKRNELTSQQEQTEKQLVQCRLINLRAVTLQNDAKNLRQQEIKQHLISHDPSILTQIENFILNPLSLQDSLLTLQHLIDNAFQAINWDNVRFAGLYGLAGLILGFAWLYHRDKRLQATPEPPRESSSATLNAIKRSLLRMLPLLLMAGFISLSLNYYPPALSAITLIANASLIFLLSYAVIRAPLQSDLNLTGFIPLDKKGKRQTRRWVNSLAITGLFSLLFNSLPIDNEFHPLLGVVQIGLNTLICLTLIRITWQISAHFLLFQRFHIDWLMTLVLFLTIGAFWLGYSNVAEFLLLRTLGTLFILLLLWLFLRIPNEIFDGLDEGRTDWQRQLRLRVNAKDEQFFPGLIWLRLALVLSVNSAALLLLLLLWGMSEQSIAILLNKMVNGIEIGNFTLEPLRLLAGIAVLGLIISITELLKKTLAETWLKRTRLSRGAREAITTIAGYIGVVLAVLMGLSVAGVQFQNLAIIAGALSVGIGFGLQNVVNNFVSGLILLFERPIRRGDWIRVGNAEGYVKDISIRSTTIQDFDRADIIIPNSELISGQVTNMFLNDNFGRVIVPIRVAYDSPVDTVISLLLDIAKTHKDVLQHQADMKPMVLFRSFGEYALNFELRCYIRNVELRLQVISDMNIKIEQLFRENKIQIPYPQQVMYMQASTASLLENNLPLPPSSR